MLVLRDYIGWMVEVFYQFYTTTSDKGVFTDACDDWIVVTRNPGHSREERLLIPITSIRLLKPIAPPSTEDQRLLRPAGPMEEQETESVEQR